MVRAMYKEVQGYFADGVRLLLLLIYSGSALTVIA